MKFKITRANENKFESGLRGFFEYKNLGIEEATSGNFGANVIKAIEGKHHYPMSFEELRQVSLVIRKFNPENLKTY